MQNASVTLTFIDLIVLAVAPGLVGGAVGVVGGLLGSYFGPRWLQDQREAAEKKRHRAEKFEELVCVLLEHKHWLNTARNVRVFTEDTELGSSPIDKAVAIVSVYFPEHHSKLNELDLASDNFELWTHEAARRRLQKHPKFNEGHGEVAEAYHKQLHELLAQLREYAKKEFQ